MPAYPLPQERTKSYVKSNSSPGGKGFNELRFEDKAHQEQIFLHAQRNLDMRVGHDCKERVSHDRHLVVGWEKDGQRGGDQIELVQQDKHLTVRRDQIEHVAGNISLTVGRGEGAAGGRLQVIIDKKKSELVGKEGYDLHVEGSYLAKVDDMVAFTVKNDYAIKAFGHNVEATEVAFKADTIHLEAGSIVLKSGPSVIHVTEKGIQIQGPMVDINCGHVVSSADIPPLPVPHDPTPSPPAAPARADDARSGHKSTPH
jgi:type VI secretion system secreted protein VgrG